jgi:hypothetical protein
MKSELRVSANDGRSLFYDKRFSVRASAIIEKDQKPSKSEIRLLSPISKRDSESPPLPIKRNSILSKSQMIDTLPEVNNKLSKSVRKVPIFYSK